MIDATVLLRLAQTIGSEGADPGSSYVAGLFHHGEDAILRKVGEEAVEVMLASKSGDRLHLVRELADLWFHTLVLLRTTAWDRRTFLHELRRREGISGLDEKASRRKDS